MSDRSYLFLPFGTWITIDPPPSGIVPPGPLMSSVAKTTVVEHDLSSVRELCPDLHPEGVDSGNDSLALTSASRDGHLELYCLGITLDNQPTPLYCALAPAMTSQSYVSDENFNSFVFNSNAVLP